LARACIGACTLTLDADGDGQREWPARDVGGFVDELRRRHGPFEAARPALAG